MPGNIRISTVVLLVMVVAGHAVASEEAAESPEKVPQKDHLGIELSSEDERFSVNAWLRGQFRFSDPFDADPLVVDDFADPPGSDFEVRRARLKVEGHVFSPRIGFYYEHELTGERPLLDLRLDLEINDNLSLRVGQYKVLYNRERVDSSGKQQFAERSIATYAFTLDRQRGVTVEGSHANSVFTVGVFEGDGRDPDARGDDPMLVGRWQWNFLGEPLGFSQSDHGMRAVPAASLSVGAARVRGPYTRYSSSGGGQLDGFTQGDDDRYTLRQWMQEFAWQYAGWSVQQEFHVKEIEDHVSAVESTLRGGYLQFGKAWEAGWTPFSSIPEVALRVARVDWDAARPDRTQDELTLAGNLFFDGHDNKLTADVSRVELGEETGASDQDVRFRLQWDVSF